MLEMDGELSIIGTKFWKEVESLWQKKKTLIYVKKECGAL